MTRADLIRALNECSESYMAIARSGLGCDLEPINLTMERADELMASIFAPNEKPSQ